MKLAGMIILMAMFCAAVYEGFVRLWNRNRRRRWGLQLNTDYQVRCLNENDEYVRKSIQREEAQ
jgi:hypothetical protein